MSIEVVSQRLPMLLPGKQEVEKAIPGVGLRRQRERRPHEADVERDGEQVRTREILAIGLHSPVSRTGAIQHEQMR